MRFSESHFKTAKYHPSYPGRFITLDEMLAWGRTFFPWYNHEHRHSGIAFLTPTDVYFGRAESVLTRRHETLLAAYAAHPERFPNGPPRRQALAPATYINPPHHNAPLLASSGQHPASAVNTQQIFTKCTHPLSQTR